MEIRIIEAKQDGLQVEYLATATGSLDGNWEQLTGTLSAAPKDGVYELIVDCDGTAGWINVDDWAVSGTGLRGTTQAQKAWFMGSQGFGYGDAAGRSGVIPMYTIG